MLIREFSADPIFLHEKIITEARGELEFRQVAGDAMPIELLPAMGLRISGQRQASGARRTAGKFRSVESGFPRREKLGRRCFVSGRAHDLAGRNVNAGSDRLEFSLRVREKFQLRVDRWHEELHVFVSTDIQKPRNEFLLQAVGSLEGSIRPVTGGAELRLHVDRQDAQ